MSSRLPLYSASSLAAIALLLVVRTIRSRTLGEMKMGERVYRRNGPDGKIRSHIVDKIKILSFVVRFIKPTYCCCSGLCSAAVVILYIATTSRRAVGVIDCYFRDIFQIQRRRRRRHLYLAHSDCFSRPSAVRFFAFFLFFFPFLSFIYWICNCNGRE